MRTLSHKWHIVSIVAILALFTVLTQSATADPGPPGSQDQHEVGPSAVTTRSSGAQEAVKVMRETVAQATNSAVFVDLPGSNTVIVVPAGHTDLLLMRFSAESACSGAPGGWCTVRLLAGGVEAAPASAGDFAFDSNDNASETGNSWESHAMERSICLAPGNHTVKAQWKTTNAGITFRLDDWSFSLERSHGCSTT